MKAAYAAEAIGLTPQRERLFTQLGIRREMYRSHRPWLAELLGPCPVYGYRREFQVPNVDYTHANGRGTRGVWFRWTLQSGKFYETRHPIGWSQHVHKFLTATGDGDVVEVSEAHISAHWEEEEVRRRWAEADWGLMF